MYPVKQSTALTIPVFAHDANGDAVTALTDGSFTKRISKNGGAFAAMTVTLTEMENGWYSMPLGTGHTDTLGVLTITLTNAGAKQINVQLRVHARLPDDLTFPATSGRSIQVETDGMVHGDVKEWLGSAPNALQTGRVDSYIGAKAAGVGLSTQEKLDVNLEADTALTDYDPPTHTELVNEINDVQADIAARPSAAAIADAVWDEARAGHVAAGSFGEGVASVQGDVTGNVDGSVASVTGAAGSVTGAVGSVTAGVTVTTNNDKTGYALSAAGVDAIHDEVVEGTTTLRESMRLANAANGGKASGMATTTAVVRDIGDSKDRITATVDADGNRTAVTLDLT